MKFSKWKKKEKEKMITDSMAEEFLIDFSFTISLHDVIALQTESPLWESRAGLHMSIQGRVDPITSRFRGQDER